MILKVLDYFGKVRFHNLIRFYSEGNAIIFNFHRIVNELSQSNRISKNEKLEISVKLLTKVIEYLDENGYVIVDLNKLHESLLKNSFNNKKLAVITFDDGYNDSYEIAFKFLTNLNIPFTIYLCTDFPDHRIQLWWYMLEKYLFERDVINFKYEGIEYKKIITNKKLKIQAFIELRNIIQQSSKVEEFLNILFQEKYDELNKMSLKMLVNWDQIVEISRNPLVTIASHSAHHRVFKYLSQEEIILDIKESIDKIEKKINKKVEHFSYPFGGADAVGEREVEIVKSIGFKTCVTTRYGKIFNFHKDFLHCLPRVTISSDIEGRYNGILFLAIDGAFSMLLNKGKRFITI